MSRLLVLACVLVTSAAHAASPDTLAEQANRMLDDGDLGGAQAKLEEAISDTRDNAAANAAMGRLKLMRGDLAGAMTSASVALGKDKKNVAALMVFVRVQALNEVPDAAVAKLTELSNQFGTDVGVLLATGEALLAAKKWPDAVAMATRVLKLQETSVAAMKQLARAYLGLERPVTAESVLQRALELERDPEALALLAGIKYGDNLLADARVLLEEAVRAKPGFVEGLNALGAIYISVQNYEAANDVLQRAIALAPTFAEAWLDIGSAQRGAGRFEQAEASWKKVLVMAPKLPDPQFNLGVMYLENPIGSRDRIQQLTDAINAFNAYKKAGGTDPETDKYIDEAKLLIKQESERRTEELKGGGK